MATHCQTCHDASVPTPSDEFPRTPTGGWGDREQVAWYTERIGRLEARLAGEAVLRGALPPLPRRVADLGCGDGRLAALVLDERPSVTEVVALDRSEPMLELARARFASEPRVVVGVGDLTEPLGPVLGAEPFDLVVSGFAIHHLEDERKRTLFGEVLAALAPGGVFADLEVVRSSTERRHEEFLAAIGRTADDPEDRLASVDDQLRWMEEAGLVEVECLWRWRGFALLAGERPVS
jgi:tRNA (cmo5U34)-methyltransferase